MDPGAEPVPDRIPSWGTIGPPAKCFAGGSMVAALYMFTGLLLTHTDTDSALSSMLSKLSKCKPQKHVFLASWLICMLDFGTYHIDRQWRIWRDCAPAQFHQSFHCS